MCGEVKGRAATNSTTLSLGAAVEALYDDRSFVEQRLFQHGAKTSTNSLLVVVPADGGGESLELMQGMT